MKIPPSHLAELHNRLSLICDEEMVLKIMVEVQEVLGRPSFSNRAARKGLDDIDFKGDSYDDKKDRKRLIGNRKKIWEVMKDGLWHTAHEIEERTGVPSASFSIRRSEISRYIQEIERRRVRGGLYEYRLKPEPAIIEMIPSVFLTSSVP